MLNGTKTNSSPINSPDRSYGTASELVSTSFSTTLGTKYGFRTSEGLYFQFNSMELRKSNYGNVLESHDLDSAPSIDVTKFSNALKNGGTIYDRRYREKSFSLTFTIYSDTIENLENEIRNLKSAMEVGGKLYKVEKEATLRTTVELTGFDVSRLRLRGTSVTVKLLTMDPFWATGNAVTTFDEENVGSFVGSITLSKTGVKGFVRHMLYLRTVTGLVNQMTFTIAGYPIVINQTFASGDTVILDGIQNDGFVNGTKVKYYGQFPELSPNVTYPLSVAFAGGGSVDAFDLYNVYENKQI